MQPETSIVKRVGAVGGPFRRPRTAVLVAGILGVAAAGVPSTALAARTPRASVPSAETLDPADTKAPIGAGRDGVRLLAANDPEYVLLRDEARKRVVPEAASRLVVVRNGVPVLDRGLRDEKWRVVPALGASAERLPEEGVIEDAEVSSDGRVAVVASTRYRRSGGGLASEFRAEGTTDLTWIDAEHPAGRWSLTVEEGRWVARIVPLSNERGVAVATGRDISGPFDLRLYGPDGKEALRVSEDEASAGNIVAATHGGFLAVDLSYPPRRGVADRGILVLDLLKGTRWTHTWSYGGEGEPLSWDLDDSGVLRIRTPAAVRHYDRNGKLLRTVKTR